MKTKKYGYIVPKKYYVIVLSIVFLLYYAYLVAVWLPKHIPQPVLSPQISPITVLNPKLTPLYQTPMEDAQNAILRASEYYNIPIEVFVGIAFAESSFKNFKGYNPWGIGNNGPKTFTSWEHSADEFGYTMRYGYFNKGLDTPEEIHLRYVGWNNPAWLKNVKVYFK